MKTILALLVAVAAIAHAQVEVGKPAPDFSLKDCSGKERSLADFKGKTVVLEWVNYGCPFVKKHYGSGNMQKLQKDATSKGVVWLAVCSSGPGKQGHFAATDAMKACTEAGSAATAYLLDEDGKVGQLYGAKRTPEMYIIDSKGTLVYHGAIDDKKTPDPADIPGATNYVAKALDEVLAGKSVSTPTTEAYGCSVKYAN